MAQLSVENPTNGYSCGCFDHILSHYYNPVNAWLPYCSAFTLFLQFSVYFVIFEVYNKLITEAETFILQTILYIFKILLTILYTVL